MGNKQSADKQDADWPPKNLEVANKGKTCPLTVNEENVATFAMG